MASADVTIVVVDGEPLALPSVLAALSHASANQPGARVGIDVGDEAEARAVAAALCAGAERGQVLVSERARWSVLGQDGHEFRELGTSDGVHGWELLWQEPAPRTRIRLCGPLELTIDGRDVAAGLPGGQAGLLVGYLLANRGRAADRDALIDVLWPERPPRDPQGALRPILSRLRHALAPAALEGRERVRLALPEPVWIDVEEAQRAIETTRALVKGEAWESAREHAAAALDLLGAEFLPGYDGEWISARRQELEEIELEALESLARAGLALAGPELNAAERAGRELIARSPFRETGYRFLMEALARAGNTAEALRVYEQLRVLLRDELGAAPAAEVQELHQRLLTGETAAEPQEPTRPAADSERRVPLPSILSPRERSAFVARERELGVLRAAWQQARSGTRRLVLVAGEPGIGKTRLTSEFAREAHAEGTVLYAGCQEEALVAYQPFVEALRHYARTTALDWDEVALGPGAGELARLVPELATPQPGDDGARADDPETRRYLLFDAISMLLAEVAARTPLAFVIDDLHWADRATLRLLRHVLRASQDAALLIVGTYRDAEIGPEHPLADLLADLRRDRLLERVSLDGLEEGEVGTLIASHAGHEAPAGLVETVHEQTEGNPFFVEEVMRHLIETGVLFERGGRWTSALTPDEIGVPEGVKEVLARRLGRLSDGCRAALAQAAVLGREFSFEVLRAMTAVDDEELIAMVEEAVGAQLAVEVTGRSGPAYAFTHALVRETLYGALSGPRKQRMHAQAAQAIERVEGDAQVGVIALHYRLAGSAGDADKAIEYSLQAGGRAAELSAWDAVADHWEGALAIMERAARPEAERARLLVALGDVMAVLGDLGRQIASFEQALSLYESLGDTERAARAHSRLGMAHSLIDSIYAEHLDIKKAFRHFDAARTVLGQGDARKARGHLQTGVATAWSYGLRIPDGIEAAAEAMEIGERIGDDLLWAGAAQAYAWHKIVAGDLREGLSTVERAFEVADRHQRPFLAFMGTNIRGQWTWALGAPDEAQPFFERWLHIPYAGKTSYRQEVADGVGRCHLSRGELAEARRLLPEARGGWLTHSLAPLVQLWDGSWDEVDALAARILETSRRTGNRWDEYSAHHVAGLLRYLRDEHEAAVGLLEQALAIVVDGGARFFEAWVRPDLARVLAESGRVGDARAHVHRCREIVGSGEDWRGMAGSVALADAVVLAREDRLDDADRMFGEADATFDRHRLRGDQAHTMHEWGRALARGGAHDLATDKLNQAAELYRRHDAGQAWLDRVAAERWS